MQLKIVYLKYFNQIVTLLSHRRQVNPIFTLIIESCPVLTPPLCPNGTVAPGLDPNGF
jgi:hypothetical protein